MLTHATPLAPAIGTLIVEHAVIQARFVVEDNPMGALRIVRKNDLLRSLSL
jgi:hypothetical protein